MAEKARDLLVPALFYKGEGLRIGES